MFVFFDLDSTLVTIEGIDELAKLKGLDQDLSELTEKIAQGQSYFEKYFPEKIRRIAPSIKDLDYLGQVYLHNFTSGVQKVIAELQGREMTVGLMTQGFFRSALPVAEELGLDLRFVYGNKLTHHESGQFLDVPTSQTLFKGNGKVTMMRRLMDEFPEEEFVMVGDSKQDMLTDKVAQKFIGFGGNRRDEEVAAEADHYIEDMRDLLDILI